MFTSIFIRFFSPYWKPESHVNTPLTPIHHHRAHSGSLPFHICDSFLWQWEIYLHSVVSVTILLFQLPPLPCMDTLVTLPVHSHPILAAPSMGSDDCYYCYCCCYFHPWWVGGAVEWMGCLCHLSHLPLFGQRDQAWRLAGAFFFNIHRMLLRSPSKRSKQFKKSLIITQHSKIDGWFQVLCVLFFHLLHRNQREEK